MQRHIDARFQSFICNRHSYTMYNMPWNTSSGKILDCARITEILNAQTQEWNTFIYLKRELRAGQSVFLARKCRDFELISENLAKKIVNKLCVSHWLTKCESYKLVITRLYNDSTKGITWKKEKKSQIRPANDDRRSHTIREIPLFT